MKPLMLNFGGACRPTRKARQGGVVLFMALIALVAMTLAAVALVRSVDSGAMVAGNIAFRQAATRTADIGIEAATSWLKATYTANKTKDVATDLSHPFNLDSGAYYSNVVADPRTRTGWTTVGTYAGNEVSYIIERMCQNAGQLPEDARCQGDPDADNNSHKVCHYNENCGQIKSIGSQYYRITARAQGPKNTLSFVQALVY